MNYIELLNMFYERIQCSRVSNNGQLLYYTLLAINNKSSWSDWFSRTNVSISGMMGVSEKAFANARAELKQLGLIDFIPSKKRGECTRYRILYPTNYGTNVGTNGGTKEVQTLVQSADINKHKLKLKQKKDTNVSKESGCGDDAAMPEKPSGAKELFEYLWSLYPEKKGKAAVPDSKKAEIAKAGKEQMERAIERYKAEYEKDKSWRKPQYGSTFFNGGYVDYLDDNFSPSERPKEKPNNFHNFESHNTDYEKIIWDGMRGEAESHE